MYKKQRMEQVPTEQGEVSPETADFCKTIGILDCLKQDNLNKCQSNLTCPNSTSTLSNLNNKTSRISVLEVLRKKDNTNINKEGVFLDEAYFIAKRDENERTVATYNLIGNIKFPATTGNKQYTSFKIGKLESHTDGIPGYYADVQFGDLKCGYVQKLPSELPSELPKYLLLLAYPKNDSIEVLAIPLVEQTHEDKNTGGGYFKKHKRLRRRLVIKGRTTYIV